MSANDQPPIVIRLIGPVPPQGEMLCATCCILYLGEVSASESVQDNARTRVDEAIAKGKKIVYLALPQSWRDVNAAVTVAPSVYFPMPMPVCWIHLQGARPGGMPSDNGQNISALITGKGQ